MVEKKPDTHEAKKTPKPDKGEPAAVDRPGFDMGGSSGETTAGSGLGLGKDASENRRDRRLPGRKGKSE